MLTDKVRRNAKGQIVSVNGKPCPKHLKVAIPPAWKKLCLDPDPSASLIAIGYDVKGRKQYLYSKEHKSDSTSRKFEKVRSLIEQHENIRSEIEEDINDHRTDYYTLEAALIAYLIYETGIRPGSTADTLGDVKAYGATTLQLRHISPCPRGVRLKFVGKKGVKQNVLVTNPYLVDELIERKEKGTGWSQPVFDCSASKLREYVHKLTGDFTPKDLRTMRGTLLAMELIEWRVRVPATKKGRKEIVNNMLDRVAAQLGNTRAVTRSAYVDPTVYEWFAEQT